MANNIIIYGLEGRSRLRDQVVKIARLALRHFQVSSKTLEIIFLGDKEMILLKRRFLRKSGPANTLSFSSGDPFPGSEHEAVCLGEIFINTDITEFKLKKISPLLIHSILHLLGYHHNNQRDTIEMDHLARQVLEVINK